MYYLDGDSHVEMLRRAFLPTWAPFELGSVEAELRPLVTEEEALMLVEAGVNTVAELVAADKYTILELRGYDVPQVCGELRKHKHRRSSSGKAAGRGRNARVSFERCGKGGTEEVVVGNTRSHAESNVYRTCLLLPRVSLPGLPFPPRKRSAFFEAAFLCFQDLTHTLIVSPFRPSPFFVAIGGSLFFTNQVPLEERLSVLHICDLRDLAVALVEKCTMDPEADQYNGEDGQPWNVEPVFAVRTTARKTVHFETTLGSGRNVRSTSATFPATSVV